MVSYRAYLGTENAYLKAWFVSQKTETPVVGGSCPSVFHTHGLNEFTELPGRQDINVPQDDSANTPRKAQLLEAGWRTIARGVHIRSFILVSKHLSCCFQTILQNLWMRTIPNPTLRSFAHSHPLGL